MAADISVEERCWRPFQEYAKCEPQRVSAAAVVRRSRRVRGMVRVRGDM